MAGEARWIRDTGQGRAPLITEEIYLTLRNLELSFSQFLMDNGIVLDARTRLFLANARDATSAVADRLGEEGYGQTPSTRSFPNDWKTQTEIGLKKIASSSLSHRSLLRVSLAAFVLAFPGTSHTEKVKVATFNAQISTWRSLELGLRQDFRWFHAPATNVPNSMILH